jgi:pimeloyl-ACP methyl ester carboxylesterase
MPSRTVSIRNGQFEADVLEAGSGDPLVYLHGIGGLRDDDPLVAALAEAGHRVIAPRHPGFGDSTGDEHLVDQSDLLYYYLDLLDELGVRDVPLVGHSLGGMFAAELAALQPERYTKVVLIAPFGLWDPENPVLDFFVASPAEQAAALFHDPQSDAAKKALPEPQNEGDVAVLLERVKAQRVAAKYLWPIPNRGLSKRLHRLRMPVEIIWGENDGIIPPSYAKDFQARLPKASVTTVPNAGHMVVTEQPQQVASAIGSFLGG